MLKKRRFNHEVFKISDGIGTIIRHINHFCLSLPSWSPPSPSSSLLPLSSPPSTLLSTPLSPWLVLLKNKQQLATPLCIDCCKKSVLLKILLLLWSRYQEQQHGVVKHPNMTVCCFVRTGPSILL